MPEPILKLGQKEYSMPYNLILIDSNCTCFLAPHCCFGRKKPLLNFWEFFPEFVNVF